MIMITLFCALLMIAVFGRLFLFALKATWRIAKFAIVFVLCPVALIALIVAGLYYIVIPVLIIIGIVSILKNGSLRVAQ